MRVEGQRFKVQGLGSRIQCFSAWRRVHLLFLHESPSLCLNVMFRRIEIYRSADLPF